MCVLCTFLCSKYVGIVHKNVYIHVYIRSTKDVYIFVHNAVDDHSIHTKWTCPQFLHITLQSVVIKLGGSAILSILH